MARSEKQKLKLCYLIKILSENTDANNGLTMQEIIDALEEEDISAERKSIYSDIALLCDFGYDIISEKEGKSYVYKMVGRDFELPELKLLVDAVQSSKFITERKSNKLIRKIESLTSKYEAKSLHRHVYVANRIKTTNESVYYNVDYIQTAISSNSKIAFKYFQWNSKKERVLRHDGATYIVSPWALTWDYENYYMIAFDDNEEIIKHYRVDKMLDIKVLDDTKRAGKAAFGAQDMAQYTRKVFGMYGGKEETVTLLCKEEMAGVIVDRFGAEVNITRSKGGYFKTRVNVEISPQFFAWVFSLGDAVEIISPASVVDDMKKHLDTVRKMYRKK